MNIYLHIDGVLLVNEKQAAYADEFLRTVLDKYPDSAKTDSIYFSQPFLWFEDDLFEHERGVLIKRGALDSHKMIDSYKNPIQPQNFISSFPLTIEFEQNG